MPHTPIRNGLSEELSPPGATMLSPRAALVRKAQEYAVSVPECPPTANQIAAHLNVSTRTLQLAFRKELGTSPITWLRDFRLDQAYRLLNHPAGAPASVLTVATSVGFVHMSNFSAIFKRRFGRTPSDVARHM